MESSSSMQLWNELILYPIMTSFGTFTLSTFISHFLYGFVDWRPVSILVSADFISMSLDHMMDHSADFSLANGNNVHRIVSPFAFAKACIALASLLFAFALAISPRYTQLLTVIVTAPAVLWSYPFPSLRKWIPWSVTEETEKESTEETFVIKRIPGLKPVMVGLIRGLGIFLVVQSVRSSSRIAEGPWTASQLVVWTTVDRICASVLLDIRDFDKDMEDDVPTIPVLLKSIFKTRILMTVVQLLNAVSFRSNPFVVFASLSTLVLYWTLDNRSPRKYFYMSIHSRTLMLLGYGAIKLCRG